MATKDQEKIEVERDERPLESGEETVLDGESKKRILRRLFSYLLRYRLRLTAGIVLSLIASFANLFSITAFVPIFNALGETGPVHLFEVGKTERKLYDLRNQGKPLRVYQSLTARWASFKISANSYVEKKSSREAIFLLAALILPLYFIKLLCVTGTLYFVGTAGLLVVRDLRLELYGKMNELGMDYFSRERTGLVMSRIINDVEVVGRSLSVEFNEALNNIFYIVTHFALLAFISVKMLFITLVIVPMVTSPVGKLAQKIRRAVTGQQERLADMGAHIQEILGGIRVIRAFSMERFEEKRFAAINHRLYQNTFHQHYYHQVGPSLTEFVATLVILGFLSWGAYEISGERLSRGLFLAFFITLIFIMRPLKQTSVLANLLSSALAAAERIFEMLDTPPGVKEDENPLPFDRFEKEIAFRNVTFVYPGSSRPALEKIDFVVPRGRTVSVVGSSGAGKSTLMDMIPRFYDVTEGAVEMDGVDVRRLKLSDLRQSIGIVTQHVFLFNATIRDNIAYGRTDITMERILEVAKAANAHDFIVSLPEGYDTSIGERGVMLSGGQRQRLAIARALLLDPPILIFDEATSALDNESEMLVKQAMERLRSGRTVFIIAHRLSTVYNSDEILVMDQGRIVERGSHRELLDSSTIYRKLYEMQFSE